jgi:hypothetical protein
VKANLSFQPCSEKGAITHFNNSMLKSPTR